MFQAKKEALPQIDFKRAFVHSYLNSFGYPPKKSRTQISCLAKHYWTALRRSQSFHEVNWRKQKATLCLWTLHIDWTNPVFKVQNQFMCEVLCGISHQIAFSKSACKQFFYCPKFRWNKKNWKKREKLLNAFLLEQLIKTNQPRTNSNQKKRLQWISKVNWQLDNTQNKTLSFNITCSRSKRLKKVQQKFTKLCVCTLLLLELPYGHTLFLRK